MFTDELGRTVRIIDGTRIGKLDDLIVQLGADDPQVVALRVRVEHRRRGRVPWSAVASFTDEVAISADPATDEVGDDELLLGREDRKSTRLNSSHSRASRMPSSA